MMDILSSQPGFRCRFDLQLSAPGFAAKTCLHGELSGNQRLDLGKRVKLTIEIGAAEVIVSVHSKGRNWRRSR